MKITPEGTVKILDFGLAKALEGETSAGNISTSPTISRMATQAGVIFGTAAYMSPEQAKGRPVDRRADVWAFGCVLYEMLTGKKPFDPEIMLSPDGRRVAIRVATSGSPASLWVYDLSSGIGTRLTFGSQFGGGSPPAWSPNGRRLAFDAGNGREIYLQPSDGSSPPRRVYSAPVSLGVNSWSPDGKSLVLFEELASGVVLKRLLLADHPRLLPLVATSGWAIEGTFSPDGKWLAYASNETGRYEIYVDPYPGPGGTFQASSNGGQLPEWLKGGSELAFIDPKDKLNVVDVRASAGQLEFGQPQVLFGGRPLPVLPGYAYAEEAGTPVYMTHDGKHIVLAVPVNLNAQTPLLLQTDWLANLNRN